MALRRDVNDIWILRVDDDSSDVLGLLQAHVLPSLACIDGLVNAVAPRGALAVIGLAASDPNNRRIGRRDGDVANGGDPFFVEDRFPGGAVVGGFPNAAGGCAHVDDVRIALDHGEIIDAAAHDRRPNLAKFQVLEPVGGALGFGRRQGEHGRGTHQRHTSDNRPKRPRR